MQIVTMPGVLYVGMRLTMQIAAQTSEMCDIKTENEHEEEDASCFLALDEKSNCQI